METDAHTQLIKDRLKVLPGELTTYILSPEFPRRIELIAKKYNFNEEQETSLQNEVSLVLMVLDSVNNLQKNLQEGLGITEDGGRLLAQDVNDYVLNRVNKYLAYTQEELIVEEMPPSPSIISTTPGPSSDEEGRNAMPSKKSILQEIEQPFKTVIKKYIIEYDHKPLQDTSHLLEDKVDDTLKLQDHYTDTTPHNLPI